MTLGTGHGAGLQNPRSSVAGTTGSIWDKPGRGADTLFFWRPEELFPGPESLAGEAGVEGRAAASSGESWLRPWSSAGLSPGGGRWQHPGPWALSTPFSVPHPGSGFPAPRLSSVLPNAKWAPSYRGKPTNGPGRPAAGSLFQRPCPRPDAVAAALTAVLTARPKRPRFSGPCRTCGPVVGAAGGLSSSRWSP